MIDVWPEHLALGCPICEHQVDMAHDAALAYEALMLAAKFAEVGYGAAFVPREEMADAC